MRTIVILSFLILGFNCSAQSDTIRIVKSKVSYYKLTQQEKNNWYIKLDGTQGILANVDIQPLEAVEWFDRFGTSQNLYIAVFQELKASAPLVFRKPNSPEESIAFVVVSAENDELILLSKETESYFVFSKF
jgi:hypothetical protein